MNEKFAVRCGVLKHRIFTTDENDPSNKTFDVTDTAVYAVRDYMVDDIPKGRDRIGYFWTREDGKRVSLICIVEGKED